MLNAYDMREFRHAGARRLRDSEWKDGKVQCLTSQDSEHLEQFLRDELIKHDVKYPHSEQKNKTKAEDKLLQNIEANSQYPYKASRYSCMTF